MKFPRRLYITLCKATAVTIASIGLFVMVGAGTAQAQGLGNGISDPASPHNFAADLWNFRGEICRVCHVPHDHARATKLYLNGLLWNHQISTETYTMYNQAWSSTIDSTQSAQPDGISKLCLGCHDGSVGINQFDRDAEVVGTDFIPLGFQVSSFRDGANVDLRGTHPLSIAYDPASDANLHAATDPMGSSGSIGDVLDNGKVQCSSCHDVHDQESVAGTHLLRVSQTAPASGLCLTCHIK